MNKYKIHYTTGYYGPEFIEADSFDVQMDGGAVFRKMPTISDHNLNYDNSSPNYVDVNVSQFYATPIIAALAKNSWIMIKLIEEEENTENN